MCTLKSYIPTIHMMVFFFFEKYDVIKSKLITWQGKIKNLRAKTYQQYQGLDPLLYSFFFLFFKEALGYLKGWHFIINKFYSLLNTQLIFWFYNVSNPYGLKLVMPLLITSMIFYSKAYYIIWIENHSFRKGTLMKLRW